MFSFFAEMEALELESLQKKEEQLEQRGENSLDWTDRETQNKFHLPGIDSLFFRISLKTAQEKIQKSSKNTQVTFDKYYFIIKIRSGPLANSSIHKSLLSLLHSSLFLPFLKSSEQNFVVEGKQHKENNTPNIVTPKRNNQQPEKHFQVLLHFELFLPRLNLGLPHLLLSYPNPSAIYPITTLPIELKTPAIEVTNPTEEDLKLGCTISVRRGMSHACSENEARKPITLDMANIPTTDPVLPIILIRTKQQESGELMTPVQE